MKIVFVLALFTFKFSVRRPFEYIPHSKSEMRDTFRNFKAKQSKKETQK